MGADVVRAAGVVLLREASGTTETLVVHRPHRSDWSLPKGKLEPGEHVVAAAVRECDEETGYLASLGVPLPRLQYVALGQPKVVDYWVARPRADEGFVPGDEVDEVRWLPIDQARSRLTYEHDADLVQLAAEQPVTSPLIILRHTQAVKRVDYKGKHDAERPLSGKGRSHAKALVPLVEAFGIEQVHSSDATRCVQTVKKFAKAISADITPEPALSEEGFHLDDASTEARMRELATDPRPIVVCSHRPVIPTLLRAAADALAVTAEDPEWDPRMPPGGFIVLHRTFGPAPGLAAIERHTIAPE